MFRTLGNINFALRIRLKNAENKPYDIMWAWNITGKLFGKENIIKITKFMNILMIHHYLFITYLL